MNHFTDIELHRWRESGPGAERDRVIGHLAECAGCSSRYAAAIQASPLRAVPAADAQEFVAAGRRVAGRRRWIAPLAAAAVVVIVIAIPLAMRRHENGPELHFRGSGIQALSPMGAIDQPEVEFVWSSSIAAPRYRLLIGDANGVIQTEETEKARLRVQLRPGSYWWSVTALDARRKPLTSSQRLTFTVRLR